MEKRSRGEAAQVQVTVTQVNTVQHSSPYPLDPEPSPNVCVDLEDSEGRMDPELDELKSSSAGQGFETPGQQCPPKEGIRGQGRTTANGFLGRGRGFKPKGKYFVTNNGKRGQTSERHDNGCRHLFECCDPVKTRAQDIQRTEQAVRPR